MTDNEIVKALYSMYRATVYKDTITMSKETAIGLYEYFNRQEAEVEALINGQETLQKYIAEQKAEIERLKRKLVGYEPSIDSGLFSQMLLEQKEKAEAFEKKWKAEVKSEAYKECIEKVKEKSKKTEIVCSGALITTNYAISAKNLNNLLKELVGDSNG